MTTKHLIEKIGISQQSLSKKTKKASDENKLFVEINGIKYSYELRREGRGRPSYHYEELQTKTITKKIQTPQLSMKLDDNAKEKLNIKLKVVTSWLDYKKDKKGGVKDFVNFINENYSFHYTQKKHYDWQREYKKNGARGLIDKRGREKGIVLKLNKDQQRFLIRNFRAFGAGEINYTQLWEELHRNEENLTGFNFMAWKVNQLPNICERKTVQRFIDNYYKKRVVEWTLITAGEDFNKSYNQPALGTRADSFESKNLCWEIDSTPADVIIFHNGKQIRPDILAIKDCYSGRCVALLAVNSNKLAIIRLMWKAIDTLGMPKVIKGDNGKDYLSKQFQNLLDNLNIKYDRAVAYCGDEKGMVERNFRTIQHSYMRSIAGFIGHNVGHRQKIEQQVAKKYRTAKDTYGNNVMTQTSSDELLNWEELEAKIQEAVFLWEIDKKRRKGPSPIEKWNSCFEPIVKINYENFLVYAGGYVQRTVQKEGINYEGQKFISTFIHKYRGQKVFVSENIDDVSELFVFDESGKLIGVLADRNISSMKKEDFVAVKKDFAKETNHIQKTIKDDKLSARSKENIKIDYKKAKEALKDNLKPQKEIRVANIELKRDVFDKRKENFLDKSSKEVITDDPFLRYVVGY